MVEALEGRGGEWDQVAHVGCRKETVESPLRSRC